MAKIEDSNKKEVESSTPGSLYIRKIKKKKVEPVKYHLPIGGLGG